MKTPISLIIDDPAPIISVYHEHARSRTTADGRPIIPTFTTEQNLKRSSFEKVGIIV